MYHITCVVRSAMAVEACVQGLRSLLLPVLTLIVDQFPFVIAGFHPTTAPVHQSQGREAAGKLRIEQQVPLAAQ
ncbi:MAG: hypothetical protein IPJ27_23345 [Candidatus Accumulibacter sp.]|uniref:Uncharacterized protein n=1 Tax=Candidatus Accumulibacter proximus TaxID=2954385 RepID=A0A935Q397_9PROT|nr:hypothetical protein [Candidatus Accumulibacter proximus]